MAKTCPQHWQPEVLGPARRSAAGRVPGKRGPVPRGGKVRILAWVSAGAVLLGACGYRFTAGGGELPGKARTLFVPLFSNQTAEPEVDAFFTSALRQELARAGRAGGDASDARAL